MSSNGGTSSLLARLRKRRFLAVDFDSGQLRLAQVVRGPMRRIRQLVAVDMPADIDITEPGQVGKLLADAIKRNHLGHLPVVMNIPRGQAILKPLRLPPGTADDEIAAMVQFQVQGELPFRPEEAVLDFTVEGEASAEDDADGPAGIDVLAAAVRLPVVDYYRNVAETAGVKLIRLGLRPYANTRCVQVVAPAEEGSNTAVVHITADETQIDVMEGSRLAFSRSAVVNVHRDEEEPATDDIADDVSELPSELSPEQQQRNRVDAVVSEIVRSLQGYAAMENASRVDRVLIAGGTGLEAGVADMLTQVESLSCSLLNPIEAVKVKGVEDVSPFITVIGLAFEAGADRAPFDFLHPKKPAAHRDPKRERLIAAALAAGILLFVGAFASWFYLDSKQQTRDELVSRKNREADREKLFVKPLVDHVSEIEEWEDGNIRWLDHWAMITSLLPPAEKAYIDDFRAPSDYIKFVVHAKDSETIAAFVEALRKAGYSPRTGKDGVNPDNRFGYPRQTEVRLDDIDADQKIMVAELKAPERPSDDDLGRSLKDVRRERRGRR